MNILNYQKSFTLLLFLVQQSFLWNNKTKLMICRTFSIFQQQLFFYVSQFCSIIINRKLQIHNQYGDVSLGPTVRACPILAPYSQLRWFTNSVLSTTSLWTSAAYWSETKYQRDAAARQTLQTSTARLCLICLVLKLQLTFYCRC